MVHSRGTQKFERVTITLVPTADERSFKYVPSTFSKTNRTYSWRHFEKMDYMIVPKKISSNEIKVDIFVDPLSKKKVQPTEIQRAVTNFVKSKIPSEWPGLKLGNISKATAASPPGQTFHRGTIEEILGSAVEG